MIRDVLRMGDPRLLAKASPVENFNSEELKQLLVDMRDTMAHLNGAGLAAPQIGVGLRVVIFGVKANPRYPDAEAVPDTVLINPILEPLSDEAYPRAEELGVAFQLANFIRDVGEDLDRGRVYLPLDELARFDLTRDDLAQRVVDDRVRDNPLPGRRLILGHEIKVPARVDLPREVR